MIQWGTVAEWVSGLGALAAAVAAVYLARSVQKIKLHVNCGIRNVKPDSETFEESAVVLSIENWDSRPVTIAMITMQIGKKAAMLLPWTLTARGFDRFPANLGDGATADFAYPLHAIKDNFKKMTEKKSDAKKVRFVISTTRGQSKSVKPEDALVDAMIDALNNQT